MTGAVNLQICFPTAVCRTQSKKKSAHFSIHTRPAFKKYAEKAQFIDAQVAAADETFAKIMPDWSKLSEAAYLGKQAASAGLESARSFSNNLFLVIGSISLILAIGLGWLIGRSITRPIKTSPES
jgi:methyl-accepting chemotaxis protein